MVGVKWYKYDIENPYHILVQSAIIAIAVLIGSIAAQFYRKETIALRDFGLVFVFSWIVVIFFYFGMYVINKYVRSK